MQHPIYEALRTETYPNVFFGGSRTDTPAAGNFAAIEVQAPATRPMLVLGVHAILETGPIDVWTTGRAVAVAESAASLMITTTAISAANQSWGPEGASASELTVTKGEVAAPGLVAASYPTFPASIEWAWLPVPIWVRPGRFFTIASLTADEALNLGIFLVNDEGTVGKVARP